jgi:hypothetical protein
MPRYFFHTRVNGDVIADTEGVSLRDADHAWEVAQTMARELLRDEGDRAHILGAIVDVRDEQGEIVLEFPFAEIVAAVPGDPTVRH